MALTDQEIIKKVLGGEKQHFARLIDRYKDRAFALAVRMLRNREDAEEAAQDAFIRAYHALGTFQGNAKFGTWFYRILYNVCLTRLGRKKDEFLATEYDDQEEYARAAEESFQALDADLEMKDLVSHIHRAIESLPQKYGTVLSLFYLQELSHQEICEVTALPLGTVKVHLFRARALLQERLQKELAAEKITI